LGALGWVSRDGTRASPGPAREVRDATEQALLVQLPLNPIYRILFR